MTEMMEFSLSEVINILINNTLSSAMASYCLLMKKLLRHHKGQKRAEVRYHKHNTHLSPWIPLIRIIATDLQQNERVAVCGMKKPLTQNSKEIAGLGAVCGNLHSDILRGDYFERFFPETNI